MDVTHCEACVLCWQLSKNAKSSVYKSLAGLIRMESRDRIIETTLLYLVRDNYFADGTIKESLRTMSSTLHSTRSVNYRSSKSFSRTATLKLVSSKSVF